MYSNEQVAEYTKRLMIELQNHLNIMEDQCRAPSPNVNVISLEIGKCMKTYSLIAHFMGVYDGIDKSQGGFRESVWALRDMQGKVADDEEVEADFEEE